MALPHLLLRQSLSRSTLVLAPYSLSLFSNLMTLEDEAGGGASKGLE